VLQCVTVRCSVLQGAAMCCSAQGCLSWTSRYRHAQCVAVCVAVCCSVLQCAAIYVAVCCSVLQCVAVCCSVLQCVAVCYSVFKRDADLVGKGRIA